MSLKNKVAILAGSTGVIAINIVKMLLKENAIIIVLAQSAKDLLWIKQMETISNGGSIITMLADYPDYYKAEQLADDIIERFGQIDLSIACFESATLNKPLNEVEITEWERTIEQNITAFFVAARLSIMGIKKSRQGMFISIDFTDHTLKRKLAKLTRLSLCMQKEMAKMFFEEIKDTNMEYYHLYVDPKKKNKAKNNYIHPDELGALILDLYDGNTKDKGTLFQWMQNNH
ncbi:SDR family NAD(P)-dependent oxidoreductase [Chitinophaga sp. LS1]|uniref:SDR family NAD(P)-dependent oxidoreductase n=1 Tax=Chitinophaga sp. LS1 TaxID=3051176 RepID=UPI002AAA8822|nr:SDR family NAD(P)-dependent oxidoreductase [Chitinophaga sp. LS1]WPV66946.1 SDR family NAD(P)-dependent oxidoreductase [Chitinophaga sp. LS1]